MNSAVKVQWAGSTMGGNSGDGDTIVTATHRENKKAHGDDGKQRVEHSVTMR